MSQVVKNITVKQLISDSDVKFGTSGVRGRVEDMTDFVCYSYARAFLQYITAKEHLAPGTHIGIAYDYRSSSPRIASACAKAIIDTGHTPINAGHVATPAIAYYGLEHQVPTIMVTGSHIPDDRNGIKFYSTNGEILKNDEKAILEQNISIDKALFHDNGSLRKAFPLGPIDETVHKNYVRRYTEFFPSNSLEGMKVALYQHSSVASNAISECLSQMGAEVIPLGYSKSFIPVDTEAVREKDIILAKQWADQYKYDAIVSTDGDGDRPLIGDENGIWLRGDIIGILCARYLGANIVVTPVNSNTAIEKSGHFDKIYRTRIGSPYVIEAMQHAANTESGTVVGYEANGGFLTQTPVTSSSATLTALPTRDAMLPILLLLISANISKQPLSSLISTLPSRVTFSDRIKDIPTVTSKEKLEELEQDNGRRLLEGVNMFYEKNIEKINKLDKTDGLRATLSNGDVIHIRPSGNAPELRCYTESRTYDDAKQLNYACIHMMRGWYQEVKDATD